MTRSEVVERQSVGVADQSDLRHLEDRCYPIPSFRQKKGWGGQYDKMASQGADRISKSRLFIAVPSTLGSYGAGNALKRKREADSCGQRGL